MTEKDALIARIMDGQRQMQHLLAQDRSNPLLASHLTMSQLKILFLLKLRGGAGGQDLAKAMGVTLATMTGIVDRLVAQDLVSRKEDPNDRRVRRVELSPTGSELIDGMITAGAEHQRRLLQSIDTDGLRVLEHAMIIMQEALAAETPDGGAATACPGSADARAE